MASTVLLQLEEELHRLQLLAENASADDFEARLRRIVHHVFSLLDVSTPHNKLTISTAVFDELPIVFYSLERAITSRVDVDNRTIHQYLRTNPGLVTAGSSRLEGLRDILTDQIHDITQAGRNLPFQAEALRLSRLVTFFLDLHLSAEELLVDHLVRCFTYEHTYYWNSQLGHNSYLDDETQQVGLALDSFIGRNQDDVPANTEALLSYSLVNNGSHIMASLDFECMDTSFLALYNTFLLLAIRKPLDSFRQDVMSYVRILVQVFKESCTVEFFDIESQESNDEKLRHICDLILGLDQSESLVTPKFRELGRSIILEMFETTRYYQTAEETSISHHDTTSIPHFLETELVDFLSNLATVISILNEQGFEFEPEYPSVFQYYVHLVYEVFADSATSDDHTYIFNVKDIITTIANFDDDANLIQNLVTQLYVMLSRLLSDVVENQTILMRAARVNNNHKNLLKRQTLFSWNRKLLSILELEFIKTEEFDSKIEKRILKRKLSIWYNKLIRFDKIQLQAASYSDKKSMANVLSSFWLRKIIAIATTTSKADAHFLKAYFVSWIEKHRSKSDKLQHCQDALENRIKEKAFTSWLQKTTQNKYLEQKSLTFLKDCQDQRDQILTANVFAAFRRRFEALSNINHDDDSLNLPLSFKLTKLGKIEQHRRLSQTFGIWRHRFEIERLSNNFESIVRLNRKSQSLSTWKMQHDLKSTESSFKTSRDKALLSSIIAQWKSVADNRLRSDITYSKSLLQRFLRQWRLNHLERHGKSRLELHVKAATLRKWKLNLLSAELSCDMNSKIASRVVHLWKLKTTSIISNRTISISLHNTNLQRKALQAWGVKHKLMMELVAIADLNFQRRYLNEIQKKSILVRTQNERVNELLKNHVPISRRILLQAVIQQWNIKYMKKFDDHTLKAVDSFTANVRTPGVLRVFFTQWRISKMHNDRRNKQLEINYHHHLETCLSKRRFFQKWARLTQEKRLDEERSLAFHRTLLHKKFLLTWYEKYVTKVDYLNDVAQNLIDQKDYLRLVDHLRKWNLRCIKIVRRNQQTCELFAEKWEKAHVRSMFELWLFKARNKSTVGDDEAFDYVDANSTIGTNSSPLAKKNPKIPTGSSILDGESYLSTPVKKRLEGSPFTPNSKGKGPSPTRLQETNQRMKFDRMDALTNRFRLAKTSSSKPFRLRTSASTRLSPPRHGNVRIPERPPAPLFDFPLSRSSSPNATSSPSSSPEPVENTAPSSISDTSILATAKKLRKIKPLIVPSANDSPDLQYSSTSKLRERLLARKTSPDKADVFGIL